MKVQELVNKKIVTIDEIKDFIDGNLSNYQQIQKALNEATGFESTRLDLNTDDNFSDSDILNANLYDEI